MTPERVIDAVERYKKELELRGYSAKELEEPKILEDWHARMCHLVWMCEETVRFAAEDRTEKAMRWLGFIQGALWAHGIKTIEEMKHDNMPPDVAFDGERR